MPDNPGRDSFAEAMRKAAPLLNLGGTLALTVLVGILAGWWLDRKLGTRPWLLVSGLFLGMILAFVYFFRTVMSPPDNGSGGSE